MLPADTPELNELLAFVVGTAWGGISLISITEGDPPVPPTDAAQSCQMIFQASADGSPLATLSNGHGITITNAANWQFTIPQQSLLLPVGKWQWIFLVTDVNGITNAYLRGTIQVYPLFN